jgi:hypothetical protein
VFTFMYAFDLAFLYIVIVSILPIVIS